MEYLQGTLAVANKHRASCGVGLRDVLPGVDLDIFGGGMFRKESQLGPATRTAVQGYWVGAGLTWRFGRGAYCDLGIPNQW
jgi:long-chain fatty acid transport protein